MTASLQLLPATMADYATLAQIGHDAFEPDKLAFGEGPTLYEDPTFLLPYLRDDDGTVQKLVLDGQTIGVVLTFQREVGYRWLGCLCLSPAHQGKGYGSQAIRLLEARYPDARRWGLDTPTQKTQNLHFYRKAGYVAIAESEPFPGFKLTVFQKDMP